MKIKKIILSGLVLVQAMLIADITNATTVNGKEISSYLPILEQTKNRVPTLDPETGLFIKEVKENLFFVTDGIYQSAFLRTEDGIVVFDIPADYGKNFRKSSNKPYLIKK